MQIIRHFEPDFATQVGFGLHVLLIGGSDHNHLISNRIARLGGQVESVAKRHKGLEKLINHPSDYGLCVIDCDGCGGLWEGRSAAHLLNESMTGIPVILISCECVQQDFPTCRLNPVVLRAPVSMISMRVGVEHALRDKIAVRRN